MDEQVKRLEVAGCRVIASLDGGKKVMHIERDDLRKMARPGTVVKVVWFFLLANLKKRGVDAIRADLAAFAGMLIKGGVIIEDVETGLLSSNEAQFRAMMALANEHIKRHCQGAKNASLNAAKRGRPLADFKPDQDKAAKAIWRNTKDYPTWPDAKVELEKIVDEDGNKFTTARAHRLWGKRK